MEHVFNPSAWRQRQMDLYESEAILVYIVRLCVEATHTLCPCGMIIEYN